MPQMYSFVDQEANWTCSGTEYLRVHAGDGAEGLGGEAFETAGRGTGLPLIMIWG